MWKLRERFVPAAISDKINAPSDGGTETRAQKPAQQERHRTPLGISAERCVILYVGGESLALNNVLMTHGGSPVRFCHVLLSKSSFTLPCGFTRFIPTIHPPVPRV